MLFHWDACDAPPAAPPGTFTTKTVDGLFRGLVAISPGAMTPVQAPAVLMIKTTFNNQTVMIRTFDTEMLQMDISGGNLPAGFKIRESPSMQSTGQTKIDDATHWHIDSFFDIFTEVSLDGGLNWTPASSGAWHVTLVQTTDPGACTASVTYPTPTANDLCDGSRPVTCSPLSGTSFAKGVTTVRCSATDTMN